MTEVEILQRRLDRERQARRQAEAILEEKALELYHANNELRSLNETLEQKIANRTYDLEASQTRLTTLISNLHAGVLVEDENRRIVLANRLFCDFFNIATPPETLAGTDCTNSAEYSKGLFEDPERFVGDIADILNRRERVIEQELHMARGVVLERDYIPISLDGEYLGHLWQYRDVTEERGARMALRQSEEKYRGIIENMELGLLEVDNEGYVQRAYPRFCEMVGYEEAELLGKKATDIFLPPAYMPVLEKQAEERAAGKAGVYEVPMRTKSGQQIWALISGAPISDMNGHVTGSIGIHYDITHQKNLQRDLVEARNRAEAAQEAEKQFLANMSHEIRTPLNAIIGIAHLMFDTHPTDEQREYLSILKNSAEMLRALISDVLDISKIRAGKLEAQQKEFDFAGLIRSLVKSTQLRLVDKPVSAEIDLDPKLQNLLIGDDLLLNQIMLNLLGNAEKFTPKGKISVRVRSEKDESVPDRLWVEIRVSDSGIGIPKEKQDVIFHAFRQVDGDIKRRFGGTGLGLAITQQLIDLQGGSIRVESEAGQGATFIVRLPYTDTGQKAAAKDHIASASATRLETEGKRVLIAEDNHMNRKYISALFRKWGLSFTFAHNGREAVELARAEQFDLILMDIQMPEMDGYEATIAIRERANLNSETPIVALTASALLSKKDKAFRAGMNDYLSKPFKPSQLHDKLLLFLNASHLSDGPAPLPCESLAAFEFNPRLHAETLADLYGDDLEYTCDMFETFLKNTAPGFDHLKHALLRGDVREFARLLHKLKPTFGMVGLPDIEQKMQALETAARSDYPDLDDLERAFDALENDFPEAVLAVESDFEKLRRSMALAA